MELNQKILKPYAPLFTDGHKYRYIILMGGRGGGRSTVISQYGLANLISEDYFRCAIMRLVHGDIRQSIYREIVDRLEEAEIDDCVDIADSTMTFEYGRNSINAVGFKKSSGQQKSKLKSLAGYTDVIIEEADEVAEEDFMQLDDSLRTVKGDISVIMALNPPDAEHWIIKRWFDLEPTDIKDFYKPVLKQKYRDSVLFISTNYKDNMVNMADDTITNYELYRETNLPYYYNVVEGLVPQNVAGKVYSGWREIEMIPFEAKLVRRGLDFGYTNDPTAIVDVYYYNGGYILDEIRYQRGMSNDDIKTFLLNQEGKVLTVADSAEPKSIDHIAAFGVDIIGATKGAGSIKRGIDFVQSQQISYTSRSHNLKKEYALYCWMIDRDGRVLNEPVGGFDHILDAVRYAMDSLEVKNIDPEKELAKKIARMRSRKARTSGLNSTR